MLEYTYEFMCRCAVKMIKSPNCLFKQQFLMRLHDVLSKINVVESLY